MSKDGFHHIVQDYYKRHNIVSSPPMCDSLWTFAFVKARFYELNINRSENTIVEELTTVPQDIRGSQQYHK